MKYHVDIYNCELNGKNYTGTISSNDEVIPFATTREDWEPMEFDSEDAAHKYVDELFDEVGIVDVLKVVD